MTLVRLFRCAPCVLVLLLSSPAWPAAPQPAIKGYSDDELLRSQLQSLERPHCAALETLTRTRTGHAVWLLKIGKGDLDHKPAVLIVAGASPEHLLGTELVLGLARRLADRDNREARDLLDRVTFYLVPRAAPDLYEDFFRRPYNQRVGNARPVDDDHDGLVDEDGPDDLNGDGQITVMRVEDPSGVMMAHPQDPRVLIEARRSENEQGQWKLYSEGRDNDHDEQFNEDPPGGVRLDRNFPFRYPYFSAGAGTYAVSEPESKALADFAFEHPNIALVLTFGPEDNLLHPWKAETPGEKDPKAGEGGPKKAPSERTAESGPPEVKAAVSSDDAALLNHLAEVYRKIHGGKDAPPATQAPGSFAQWAYFHYGRWSLAARAWWIPPGDKPATDKKQPDSKPQTESASDSKKRNDKRGTEDLNTLRWFAAHKIDGFVPWKPVQHPDFLGRKVEVGGFKPFLRSNPPAEEIPGLVDKHWTFLARLVEWLPRVEILQTKVEPLGKGTWRVTAEVLNRGYLPSMSKQGVASRQPHPLQIELKLPRQAALVTGSARSEISVLAGNGGKAEHSWLVTSVEKTPLQAQIRVWSPSVGQAEATIQLAAPNTPPEAENLSQNHPGHVGRPGKTELPTGSGTGSKASQEPKP